LLDWQLLFSYIQATQKGIVTIIGEGRPKHVFIEEVEIKADHVYTVGSPLGDSRK
jgi:hypothetical protein